MMSQDTAKTALKHTVDGSEIQGSPVEGTVVYPIIYNCFVDPRWLFGISSINSRTLIIMADASQNLK